MSVRNDTKELTADDDHDVTAQVDITVAALTLDADGRVTGAVADVAEPALTVGADGTVSAPEMVKTKVELGDSYGSARGIQSGQGMVRAQRGLVRLPEGQDPY